MRDLLAKNIGWKLLSLAIAILLWIVVSNEPALSTFISVPVEYKNLGTDVEINSDVVETVMLEVRGASGELRSLPDARQRYAVILDMSDVGPGQHTFTIDRGSVRMPRAIRLVRAIPAQIRLNLERSAMRKVPVEVRLASGLPPDLQVVAAVPDPPALAIAGPISGVARVVTVETDPISVVPQPGTVEYHAEAFLTDPHVRFQDSPRVTVRVTVEKK